MDLLEQMATFVRIVEAGTMSAAARQLHMSSAAVSRQLAALEADLGSSLLLRTTRRLTVTDLGRRYYERCVGILRDVEDAQSLGHAQGKAQGLLTVSAPVTLGLAQVSPHLPSLLVKHPGLRIELRLEDRIVDLVGDAVDIAIRAGVPPPDSDALVAHTLLSFRRVTVASSAYLTARGAPEEPDDLVKHDLLAHLPPTGALGSLHFRRDGRDVEVRVPALLRSNAPYALRDAAVRGMGVAVLPEWLVREDIEAGVLRQVLAAWETPPVSMSAIHRAELRGVPRVRAFVEHLREAYAADAERGAAKPRTAPRGRGQARREG